MTLDTHALARELADAYATRRTDVVPPSSRGAAFSLATAYDVEAQLVDRRRHDGHHPVGLKVGFANKAMWRALKLETLVYGHMYDDTVHRASGGRATLPVASMASPKIEPEIVFVLKQPIADGADAAGALSCVDAIALGFEIIDCVYQDWKFQPLDFVAAYGLHAGLVVGAPVPVTDANRAALVEQLPSFKVRLLKNGETVAEGSGRNSLRSPALCLAELANATNRAGGIAKLNPGDLVSSGTLTESVPLRAGETWRAEVEGIDLEAIELLAV